MCNPYVEEYQNNTDSQISILHMRKWLKPGVLSSTCECQVRGYSKPYMNVRVCTSVCEGAVMV